MTNQEKKEQLNRYRTLVNEVDYILEDLQFWRERAKKVSPYRVFSIADDKICSKDKMLSVAGALDELGRKADAKILELYELKKEIEQAIESVKEPTLRILLRYKYLEGKTLEEIASLIHYGKRQTERLHGNALTAITLKDVGECRPGYRLY